MKTTAIGFNAEQLLTLLHLLQVTERIPATMEHQHHLMGWNYDLSNLLSLRESLEYAYYQISK